MLNINRAKQLIDEVRTAMTNACSIARQCGISDHEMERFAHIFV
jgi:hypothetical protein